MYRTYRLTGTSSSWDGRVARFRGSINGSLVFESVNGPQEQFLLDRRAVDQR